ncbi:hypothetical protein Q31b_07950 [Novipirellula aureliae]|uniref:Polysaccharide biosynthesis protein n=1 Tax=Novipirellula aureliae TaxID=2527966 RepID=A0A5C6EEG9_9BACT|nr:oligosaccharide flippase family protein [Novipirellula aureliae]TWU45619.1 hypothetical protein Q31b_07950 [Novipirellula aureliae]
MNRHVGIGIRIPLILISINVIGVLLGYGATMIVANSLAPVAFEHYITAVATLSLLSSLGETGFGKYALRIIPAYRGEGKAYHVRLYVALSVFSVIIFSALIAAVGYPIAIRLLDSPHPLTLRLAFLGMPLIALAAVAIDMWFAFLHPLFGVVLARIVMPATTFGLLITCIYQDLLSPMGAVGCYLSGSVAVLVVSALAIWQSNVLNQASTEPKSHVEKKSIARFFVQWWSWIKISSSYLQYYLLIIVIWRSPLVIASYLPHAAGDVAHLAPAFELGCLVSLIGKATDKYYQPILAEHLQRCRWRHVRVLMARRGRIVWAVVLVYLLTIFLGGPAILNLYGERYTVGYGWMLIIGIGSSAWTVCSFTSSCLLYTGKNQIFVTLAGLHILATFTFMAWLFPAYGPLGAAIAFTIPLLSLSASVVAFSMRRLRRLSKNLAQDWAYLRET